MLAYFPDLYEDELLYSGIARYHMHSGNRTQKQTIRDLFDDRLVCSTTDLPSSLGILAEKLNHRYLTEQLIEDHTLLPYYASYVNQEKMNSVKILMEKGTTQGEVHAALGLLATNIKMPRYLKYCIVCYNDDMKKGEPYWHRSHQLPGVQLCPIHKVTLHESNIAYSTQEQKFWFEPLAMQSEVQHCELLFDSRWIEHLKFIAEESYLLLQGSSSSTPSYKVLLEECGYMTVGKKIRFDRLVHDFRKFFTDELLKYLYCDIDVNSSDTWLHKIVRNNTKITHPLRHLLLKRFIKESANNVVTSKISPFGQGPWPCLNKAAIHYHEEVVTKLSITRGYKDYKLVGIFECSCGFVYSRSGPDKFNDDKYRIGRIKSFGTVWYKKLEDLNESKLSLREKARLLGVDPETIRNHTANKMSTRLKLSIKYEKKVLITTVIGTSFVRKERVNWEQRDNLLYDAVMNAIERIINLSEPQRISIASIRRQFEDKNLSQKLNRNLWKLPKTKSYIDKHVDTTESYQIRRLVWASKHLIESEGRVIGWKLIKLAGLNKPLRQVVYDKYIEITTVD